MIKQSILERLTKTSICEPTEYTIENLDAADFYYSISDFINDMFPETINITRLNASHGNIRISCTGLAFFFRLVICSVVTTEDTKVSLTANENIITIVINYREERTDISKLSRIAENSGLKITRCEEGTLEFSLEIMPSKRHKIYAQNARTFIKYLYDAVLQ